MSNESEAKNYEVGYRKPPAKTQFKKGRSGNPKGRPKGSLNVAAVLARTLRESVVINENGQRKTITKMEAAVKQLANQAASGDLAAVRQLLALSVLAEQSSKDTKPEGSSLKEADEKVMAQILKRFEQGRKEE